MTRRVFPSWPRRNGCLTRQGGGIPAVQRDEEVSALLNTTGDQQGVSRSPIPVETDAGSPWVSLLKREREEGVAPPQTVAVQKGEDGVAPLCAVAIEKRGGGVPLLLPSPSKRERGGGMPLLVSSPSKRERGGGVPLLKPSLSKRERGGVVLLIKKQKKKKAYLLRPPSLPSTCGCRRFESK